MCIKGTKFDATNLAKFFNKQNDENKFKELSSNIEIDFKNIKVPMSEKLENFKLLGQIKKGQFVKFRQKAILEEIILDISMKKDKINNKIFGNLFRFDSTVINKKQFF